MKMKSLRSDSLRGYGLGLAGLLLLVAGGVLASNVEDEEEEPISGAGLNPPTALVKEKKLLAETRGFSLLGGLSGYYGGDGNVFRSPEELKKESAAWGSAGYLRADTRGGRNRLLNTVRLRQTSYPGHRSANAHFYSSSNWYSRDLGRGLSMELDGDLSRQNDDATTIAGQKYDRNYGYWRYAGEFVLSYEPSRLHRIRIGAERIRRDYDETSGFNSIDWNQWLVTSSYRLRLMRGHAVAASYTYGEQRYADEPASLLTGRETPDAPNEHHRHRDLVLGYSLSMGRRLSLDASWNRTTKEDLYRGYENRRTEGVSASIGLRPLDVVEGTIEVSRAWRDYAHVTGDAGRPLVYRTQDVGAGIRWRATPFAWVFAQLARYERETNKSTGTLYRSYRGTVARGGVSTYF